MLNEINHIFFFGWGGEVFSGDALNSHQEPGARDSVDETKAELTFGGHRRASLAWHLVLILCL